MPVRKTEEVIGGPSGCGGSETCACSSWCRVFRGPGSDSRSCRSGPQFGRLTFSVAEQRLTELTQEALVAAIEVQAEAGDGGVGDGVEGGAELPVDGFDEADEVDFDLALEFGDDIGSFRSPPLARK